MSKANLYLLFTNPNEDKIVVVIKYLKGTYKVMTSCVGQYQLEKSSHVLGLC